MPNVPLEKPSTQIEIKDGLQSIKTEEANEGQAEEKEKVPVKLHSIVKVEKYRSKRSNTKDILKLGNTLALT